MSGLPNFPVTGKILSNSVAEDRFSLVLNPVSNASFPAGQYVFYSKNHSLWYKYKTPIQNWSSELLYIAGGSASNTKFDANGYPVTGFSRADGSINIQYYVDGQPTTVAVAASGTLPTVVVDANDTYLFFIPPNYSNEFSYVQGFDNFSIVKPYNAVIPPTVTAMQIQVVNDGRYLFSFECDTVSSQKVYISFSNPEFQLVSKNLPAYVMFYPTTLLEDSVAVAEQGYTDMLNLVIQAAAHNQDFFLNENGEIHDIVLVRSEVELTPEYFVVNEKSDLALITDIIASIKLDSLAIGMSDNIAPNATLTFIPQSHFIVNEYFVVRENVDSYHLTDQVTSDSLGSAMLEIDDPGTIFSTEYIPAVVASPAMDLLYIKENSLVSTFTTLASSGGGNGGSGNLPSTFTKLLNDYFVAAEGVMPADYDLHAIIVPLHTALTDYFALYDGALPQTTMHTIPSTKIALKEQFTLDDNFKSLIKLTPLIFYNQKEAFVVADSSNPERSFEIVTLTQRVMEKLQIHEELNIIFAGQADYSVKNLEELSLAFNVESHALTQAKDATRNYKESVSLTEGQQVTTTVAGISFDILRDIGPYVYNFPYFTTQTLSTTTFTGSNSAITSFYYYKGTQLKSNIGPQSYNVVVSDMTPVIYTFTEIT